MRRATTVLTVIAFAIVAAQAWALVSVYFQASLDGDITYPERFARDLLAGVYPLSGWTLSSAPYFFPDFAGVTLLAALADEPVVPYYAVASYLAFAALIGCTLRRAGWEGAGAWLAGALLVNAWLAWRGVTDHARVLWWLGGPGFHGGAVLVGLALFCLWAGPAVERLSPRRFLLATALGWLGAVSDSLVLTQFLGPIGAALFFSSGAERWRAPRVRQFAVGLLIILTGVALWRVSLSLVGGWQFSRVFRYAPTPEALGNAVAQFSRDALGPILQNGGGIFAVGVAALVAAALLTATRATWTDRRGQFGLFVLLSVASTVALPLVSVYWRDAQHARYLLPLGVLPLVWLVAELGARFRPTWAGGAAIAAVVLLVLFGASGVRDVRSGAANYPHPPAVAAFDAFVRRENLRRGLGDYWTAHYLNATTRSGAWLNQLRPHGAVQFWNNNGFHHFDRVGAGGELEASPYDFIVTRNLDHAVLREKFGPPTREEQVGEYEIWLYAGPARARLSAAIDAEVRAQLQARRGFSRVVSSELSAAAPKTD